MAMQRLEGISFSSRRLQMQYNAVTAKPHPGIMNAAYDNPERPSTPSFNGGYFTDYEPQPTSPYIFGAPEPVKTTVPTSASTADFLPPKEKSNKQCCNYHRLLILLLLFFILLSLVMVLLYIWKPSGSENDNEDKNTGSPTQQAASSPSRCRTIPKPVAFKTIPSKLRAALDAFESFIQQKVKLSSPMALTANIVYRDKVIWEGHFGVMNNSAAIKTKPTNKTVFPVASVSKVLTVVMLYKLYDENNVGSLDDPVTTYAPGFFVNNPFNSAPITLRQLASHRSGLQREAPCFPDTKENICPYTNSEMMQRLRNLTLLRRPGTEPQYSNLGVALLGQVLGNRFSTSYEEWMRTNMFSLLEMWDTTFTVDQRLKERIPVGYTSATESYGVQEWGWLNPTGGAFSTVADFAKLEMALFNDGLNPYLSKAVTEELFAPGYILPNGKQTVGTPWESEIHDELLLRVKRGYVYGYDSRIFLVPEIKLALNFFCTNCGLLKSPIEKNFKTAFLPAFKEILRKEASQEIKVPPETKQYIGNYLVEGLAPLKSLEVRRVEDGSLHIFANGQNDIFVLNYTKPLNFKIVIPDTLPCMQIVALGINSERVVFDTPSRVDGLCDGFTMYGAHPSGRTYFDRDRDSDKASHA